MALDIGPVAVHYAKEVENSGALLAAGILAVHPVMVESIAWMTEQKNTLSTVFFLAAMAVYLEFDQSRRPSRYFAALGLFALALLSKTATVALPVGLLVIFWWQRGKLRWKQDLLPLVPFFALGAAAGLITIWVEWKSIGDNGTDFNMTFLERGLIAGRAIWFYLAKLLWPVNLYAVYPRWTVDSGQWWQWVFPIAALAMTILLWAIHKHWRAPLAAWLFFCATLFPVLGFVNVSYFSYSFVADHFQYLASLGVITLVAAWITLALDRVARASHHVVRVLPILIVALLAVLSGRQSRIYANGAAFYQVTIDQNPKCWMAHNNLAMILAGKGDLTNAIVHYREAIRERPDYPAALNNLGLALTSNGQRGSHRVLGTARSVCSPISEQLITTSAER